MVALNEKFSHGGVPASEWRVSPHEIDAIDLTTRSEEIRGGSVANFGGAGFRGLSDASPLRRRSPAPVNRNDPETQLYYVRNRTYSPGLGRWIQRDPIGYEGGINSYEYVKGNPVLRKDPSGLENCRERLASCQSTCDWAYRQAGKAANEDLQACLKRMRCQPNPMPGQVVIGTSTCYGYYTAIMSIAGTEYKTCLFVTCNAEYFWCEARPYMNPPPGPHDWPGPTAF